MVVYYWAVFQTAPVLQSLDLQLFCWVRSRVPPRSPAEPFSPARDTCEVVDAVSLTAKLAWLQGALALLADPPWTVGPCSPSLGFGFPPISQAKYTAYPLPQNLRVFLVNVYLVALHSTQGSTLMGRIDKALEEDRLTSECWLPPLAGWGWHRFLYPSEHVSHSVKWKLWEEQTLIARSL